MTALVRNRTGRTAHRAECPAARAPHAVMVPWRWAEGRTYDEIARAAAATGVHGCRTCRPFEAPA